ncbi:hypothetical protein KUF83_28725 [Streptomyces sp. BV286]|uniref:DUF5819 family protein n=1 Tax=Streptomyces sp. BV286 TaxID=2849672 RepID=UPI001C2EB986|nr:DUF5819 family protein [Streptomyces sp. BV286]MBV1940525.1 hypothetical protein [Streptomyces sp. BV286]
MDAYDEGSNARPVPGEPAATTPGTPPPDGPAAPGAPAAPGDGSAGVPHQLGDPVRESAAHDQEVHEPVAYDREAPEPPAYGHAAHDSVVRDPVVHDSSAYAQGPPAPVLRPAGTSPSADTPPSVDAPPSGGIAALSLPFQIAAALALAFVAVVACVHIGMVFLHVAPSNTVTKQHGQAIDEWVYPEFEQNWKLFAPNPLQQNIAVQVRADVRAVDGSIRTTRWYDLSALDGRAIDGNLLPSHTQQNELRRAWDFFVATHDTANRPNGLRGDLSERYLRRIVVLRLDREEAGGRGAVIQQVQVRSRTTNVPPPKWSREQVSDKPVLRQLPWWPVSKTDRAAGTRPADSTETAANAR